MTNQDQPCPLTQLLANLPPQPSVEHLSVIHSIMQEHRRAKQEERAAKEEERRMKELELEILRIKGSVGLCNCIHLAMRDSDVSLCVCQ